jgi:hypothetical protein
MFIKKDKEILFYPSNSSCAEHIDPPFPSSKNNIPTWYKKLPKYTNNEKKFKYLNRVSNLTVKSCLPIIDAFTSGYTFVLHCDLQVSRNIDGSAFITWAFNDPNIADPVVHRTVNLESSVCGWKDLDGYDNLEFNWMPLWSVKTPKGYSSIFTHPINRVDLPFYTIGGVLDTDGWGDAGNQPFLLKSGWEGIIPKGTPIFQVIPFKRDNWKSFANKEMTEQHRKQINKRDSFLKDYYKKNIWNSKNYK